MARPRVGRRGLLHVGKVVGHHVREVHDIRAKRLEFVARGEGRVAVGSVAGTVAERVKKVGGGAPAG